MGRKEAAARSPVPAGHAGRSLCMSSQDRTEEAIVCSTSRPALFSCARAARSPCADNTFSLSCEPERKTGVQASLTPRVKRRALGWEEMLKILVLLALGELAD